MDAGVQQHIEHERSRQRQQEREAAMRHIEEGRRPWEDEAGVMAVVAAVRDVAFPMRLDELREAVGDRQVRVAGRTTFAMEDILRRLGQKMDPQKDPLVEGEQVPSLKDFQSIAQRHWEAIEFMATPEEQRPRSERDVSRSGRPA